jgi:hypothetical protein
MLVKKVTILFIMGLSSLSAQENLIHDLIDIVNQAEKQKQEETKVLNYAFKQRMRTQWIARDALLVSMDYNRSFYQQEMLQNANLFHENLINLLASKADIDKVKREDKNFEQKIQDLNLTWMKFYDSVKKVAESSENKDALKFIAENNIKLLKDIAYIFTHFIKSYNSTDKLEASMAHIKTMLYTQVGKPRMYINKLVKERLLIKNNIDIEENQKSLEQSIKDMDRLMKALKDGDKGLELNGTEDRTILEKLAISQKIWEEVKLLVEKKKLTDEEWITLIQKNEEFIKIHTEVVKLTRTSNDS